MADGQPVVLRQLGGSGLVVELRDAMLPEAGIETAVVQRVSRAWLPGARRPVTQVLGATEEPFVLVGRVRDELVGAGAARAVDRDLGRMCREGYTVELQWGDAWSLEGLVDAYRPTVHADGFVEYRIEFAVHERHDTSAAVDVDIGELVTIYVESARLELGKLRELVETPPTAFG